MNDRAVALLENYDFTVLRTWKGRGAILFETNTGTKILMEYTRSKEKLILLEAILNQIKASGICLVDTYEHTKEGALYVNDRDETTYIVKEYYDVRECNIRDSEDLIQGAEKLAQLHSVLKNPLEANSEIAVPNTRLLTLFDELTKHNRELVRTFRYLNELSQRSEFELYLLHHFKQYLAQAKEVTATVEAEDFSDLYREVTEQKTYCHGDYQYHNIIFSEQGTAIIHFERISCDIMIKDLYYYRRKAMEKNEWQQDLFFQIIMEYETVRPLTNSEKKQIYYRLLYPEKFWKIVNYYINTSKSRMPGRNYEKLERFMQQEEAKRNLMKQLKVHFL